MNGLRLSIELVPKPLWGRSLKSRIRPKEWKRLREGVLARYNNCCGVCGAGGRMNCHEVWEYDDVNHIQRLVDLIPLCNMCHNCKHMGRSEKLGRQGKLDYDAVVEHFCRINGVSRAVHETVYGEAYRQWEERNKYEWTQDFGEWSHLVPQ